MKEVHGDDDWSQSFTKQVFLSVDAAEASAKRVKRTPPPPGDGGAGANHLASTSHLPPPPPSPPPLSLARCQYNVKRRRDFGSSVHTPSKDVKEKPTPDAKRRRNNSPVLPSSIVADSYPSAKRRRNNSHVLPSSIVAAPYPSSPPPCNADDSKMRDTPLRFGGKIVYSKTRSEVEEAALGLKQILEDKKREVGTVAIGLDIEWKPSFRKGVLPGKAAVVQICFGHDLCHVMHIFHSGIPPTLLRLLEDPSLLKVGVGIHDDGVKMYKDHKVRLKSLKDLSSLANQKLGGVPRQWGLKGLTEMLLSKQLSKAKKIRCGNWQAYSLSECQLEYAATDAFASWLLYKVLKGYPDAEDNVIKIQE